MTLLDAAVSGTQTLGKIDNYWHIFTAGLFLIVLMFVLYLIVKAKTWPPPCEKDGKPPSGSSSCSGISKTKAIIGVIVLILLVILSIYFRWSYRNNKYLQGAQGLGAEASIVGGLFNN